MDIESLRRFSELIKVDLVYEDAEGSVTACFDSVEDSPLMQDAQLRERLRLACLDHSSPFFYRDELRICFTVFAVQGGFLYLGPMCSARLDPNQRSSFLRSHQVDPRETRSLRAFTPRQIRDVSLLLAALIDENRPVDESLFSDSPAAIGSEQELRTEQSEYISEEEASRDEDAYRHTYHEEQQIIRAIREGRAADAIRFSEQLDADAGLFSQQDLIHWRTTAVISITIVARAAISAGVSPAVAYRTSGYYIGKCNTAMDSRAILQYRNRHIEDCCAKVKVLGSAQQLSPYTEKCRDYIQKHFREKIYIEEIAAPLGISAGYLAKQFKKDTGLLIQEYINQVRVERAANLLVYSDYTLSAIAEYVHFPTQSYFGKIFKQLKGMTPNDYRKQHRISEFWEN